MECSSVSLFQENAQKVPLPREEEGHKTGEVKEIGLRVLKKEGLSVETVKSLKDVKAVDIGRTGRVSFHNLPQLVMLKKFIEGVKNPHESWKDNIPLSKWEGVYCNKRGEVISIIWMGMNLKGTLDWEYLPFSLKTIKLGSDKCVLHNNLHENPIEEIYTYRNYLEGEICFSALPINLKTLNVRRNRFTGVFVLNELPRGVKKINLSNNPKIKGEFNKREFSKYKLTLRILTKNTQIKIIE